MSATVDNTFGILYDGILISAALYGTACIQAWIYYRRYVNKDQLLVKILVAAVLACDTAQQALLSHAVYIYLVKGHLSMTIFGTVVNTFVLSIIPGALVSLFVQQFYVFRIYRLSESNWFVAGFVSCVSIGAFVPLMIYVARALKIPDVLGLLSLQKVLTAENSLSTATDILISLILVYLLKRQKSDNTKTTDIINRLVIFTFSTCLPTSFCAIAAEVSLLAWPATLVYVFWFLLVGRFYTNSLLVSLNARDYIRSGGSDPGTVISFSMQRIQFQNGSATSNTRQNTTVNTEPISFAIDVDKQASLGHGDVESGIFHGNKHERGHAL